MGWSFGATFDHLPEPLKRQSPGTCERGRNTHAFRCALDALASARRRREERLQRLSEGVSRRRFLGATAAAPGLMMASGLLSRAFGSTGDPQPIPQVIPLGQGLPDIHIQLPGLAHPPDADPATITDFNGHVGYAVIAVALVVIGAFTAIAQGQTPAKVFEGTLVDSKCYLAHGEMGNDHSGMKECGTVCLRGGTPGALVMADKSFKMIVAPSLALAPHVGQTIRVTGAEMSGVIVPTKVEVKKGNAWVAIKIDGMM